MAEWNKENVKYSSISLSIHTYTYIHTEILFSHKKWQEGNPSICDNMDGPQAHYAKWYKSDRERQIQCAITYMRNLKMSNLLRRKKKKGKKVKLCLPEDGSREIRAQTCEKY